MIKCTNKECNKQPTIQLGIGSNPEYCHHTHYTTQRLESFQDIEEFFPEAEADDLNWFFTGTSGVHGTYTTLEEIEKAWDITDGEQEGYEGRNVTVLIVKPRMVTCVYGDVTIETKEQLSFLKKLAESTKKIISERIV